MPLLTFVAAKQGSRVLAHLPLAMLALFVVGACIPIPASAQTSAPKDATAMGILQQMNQATGWTPGTLTDGVASATITSSNPNAPVKNIVVKARPGGQVRTEFPDQGDVFIVNANGGEHITQNGNIQDLPVQTTYSALPLMFPFFTLIGQYNDPTVAVAYLGTQPMQGDTAYQIELKTPNDSTGAPNDFLARATRIVVDISTTTNLPLAMEFSRLAADNSNAGISVICYFSSYQRVGTVLVPFQIQESASGQQLFTMQLSSAQLNVGLPDSDFTLQ